MSTSSTQTTQKRAQASGKSPRDRLLELERALVRNRHRRATAAMTSWLSITVLAGALYLLLSSPHQALASWPHANLTLLGGLSLLVYTAWGYVVTLGKRTDRRVLELGAEQESDLARSRGHHRRLMEICVASRTLARYTTDEALGSRLAQIGFDVFDCERASVMLIDPPTGELVVRGAVGHGDMDLVLGARQEVGDGIAGWVAEHRKPILLGPQVDVHKFWRFKPKVEPIHAAMAAPIVFRDRVLGVLCVSSRQPGTVYHQDDLRTLQVLAWNAAMAMLRPLDGSALEDAGPDEPMQKSA